MQSPFLLFTNSQSVRKNIKSPVYGMKYLLCLHWKGWNSF